MMEALRNGDYALAPWQLFLDCAPETDLGSASPPPTKLSWEDQAREKAEWLASYFAPQGEHRAGYGVTAIAPNGQEFHFWAEPVTMMKVTKMD